MADVTDAHPIAQLSVTLGAFADLVSEKDRTPQPLAMDDHALADAVRRVLALTAVSAQHTVRHTSIDAVDRPLLVARYASTYIDTLDPSPRRVLALDHIAAVTENHPPRTVNEQLDAALHLWRAAAHREVSRVVPSTEVLSSIADQGVRLYAVTHQLMRSVPGHEGDVANPDVCREPREGGSALRAAEATLTGFTSLTSPSHNFVSATRELFTTLQQGREMATVHDSSLDHETALVSLAHVLHRGGPHHHRARHRVSP